MVVKRLGVGDIPIGDDAGRNAVAKASTIEKADLGLHRIAHRIGQDVGQVGLTAPDQPVAFGVFYNQVEIAISNLSGCHLIQTLMGPVDGRAHAGSFIGNVLDGHERSADAAVGGNHKFAHIGELRTGLGDGDEFAIQVRHQVTRDDGVGMPVQHRIDTAGGGDKLMGSDSQGRLFLTQVRENDNIVSAFSTRFIHGGLHQTTDVIGTEIIGLVSVFIVEGVTLSNHRFRRSDADESDAARSVGPDRIGREARLRCTILVEIGTEDGSADLRHKFLHTVHPVIKFVVPQRDGIIAHRLHHIHDILSTGKSPRIAPLQIVPATDDGGPGRIAGRNGIIKARQPRITVNGTMHVIIRQDDDALFRPGVREILTLATCRH